MNLESMISSLSALRPYTRIRVRLQPFNLWKVQTATYYALRGAATERAIEVSARDLQRVEYRNGPAHREVEIIVLPHLPLAQWLVDLALAIDSFEVLS